MADEAATLARRWFREVWSERRRSTIHELMAPGTVGHSPTGVTRGPDEWAAVWDRLTGAFPDIAVTVEDVVSDGRNAIVRWRMKMTHEGDHLNPTGATLPEGARREIARLASDAHLTILEDDSLVDIALAAPPPPSLAALAPRAPVVSIGSLSKLCSGGLRMGWSRAPAA